MDYSQLENLSAFIRVISEIGEIRGRIYLITVVSSEMYPENREPTTGETNVSRHHANNSPIARLGPIAARHGSVGKRRRLAEEARSAGGAAPRSRIINGFWIF